MVRFKDLENPPSSRITLFSVSDRRPLVGTHAPVADLANRIHMLNRELATDPDPLVSRAAKYLWQALTDARPVAALLPSDALGFVHICGKKFRVLNNIEIDLSVELLTAPGRPAVQLRVPARAARDMLLDVPDTARLLFAGQEVALAAMGPSRCP
jgi:hypothetical protein